MYFLIKIISQPGFCDQRFVGYRILAFLDLYWAILTISGLFRHFRMSEGHTMYETLIETCTFWTKWGVSQVPATNGSRDIGFGPFWHFWTNLAQFRHFPTKIQIESFYRWLCRYQMILSCKFRLGTNFVSDILIMPLLKSEVSSGT